jgi:hypothetical protein
MMKRGGQWEHMLHDTKNSKLIDYFFSYEQEGSIENTDWKEEPLQSSHQ